MEHTPDSYKMRNPEIQPMDREAKMKLSSSAAYEIAQHLAIEMNISQRLSYSERREWVRRKAKELKKKVK